MNNGLLFKLIITTEAKACIAVIQVNITLYQESNNIIQPNKTI